MGCMTDRLNNFQPLHLVFTARGSENLNTPKMCLPIMDIELFPNVYRGSLSQCNKTRKRNEKYAE
jgi:hypothetical protein